MVVDGLGAVGVAPLRESVPPQATTSTPSASAAARASLSLNTHLGVGGELRSIQRGIQTASIQQFTMIAGLD